MNPRFMNKLAVILLLAAYTSAAAPAVDAVSAPRSILANSDFSEAGGDGGPAWWVINRTLLAETNIVRQKKAENSPEWVVVARPGAYAIIHQTVMLTAGRKYTLKVIARSQTEGSTLGACQYDFAQHLSHIMWQTPLTREFKEYVKTFTAYFGMQAISLYNIAPAGGPGQGTLEIAGVYLYDGESAP